MIGQMHPDWSAGRIVWRTSSDAGLCAKNRQNHVPVCTPAPPVTSPWGAQICGLEKSVGIRETSAGLGKRSCCIEDSPTASHNDVGGIVRAGCTSAMCDHAKKKGVTDSCPGPWRPQPLVLLLAVARPMIGILGSSTSTVHQRRPFAGRIFSGGKARDSVDLCFAHDWLRYNCLCC